MLQNVNRQRPGQPNKESVLDVTTPNNNEHSLCCNRQFVQTKSNKFFLYIIVNQHYSSKWARVC